MILTKPQRRLVWELFLMVREVMPTNEATNRRLTEFARKFQEYERELEASDD